MQVSCIQIFKEPRITTGCRHCDWPLAVKQNAASDGTFRFKPVGVGFCQIPLPNQAADLKESTLKLSRRCYLTGLRESFRQESVLLFHPWNLLIAYPRFEQLG
jgi:hypothetical protein